MKRLLVIAAIVAAFFAGSLGLPLLVGIWLPDVVSAPRRTLAEHRSTDGYSFRVIQFWNRIDFYSTHLHVTAPDGSTEVFVLDGDDRKSWHLPLVINEQNRTATVTLSGDRVRRVKW